jgi:hypothetical protein
MEGNPVGISKLLVHQFSNFYSKLSDIKAVEIFKATKQPRSVFQQEIHYTGYRLFIFTIKVTQKSVKLTYLKRYCIYHVDFQTVVE